jgi:hypothetical protein
MALNVGRKSWVELAMEVTPGVPVPGVTNLYEVTESLEGMAKPLQQTAGYSQRDKIWQASPGEQWGQGDIEWNLDPLVTPYLLGAALGTITDTTLSGVVVSHNLAQNQASLPQTLSIYRSRVVDQQLFAYSAVDSLDISFSVDKFATGKASIKSFFPQTTTSGSVTKASTTLFTWGGASLQFGTSVVNAEGAAPTPVTDFSYELKNNTEVIFESGQLTATRIAHKDFEVSGDYTLYFETVTERNKFYNTTANAMVLTFYGANLGLGNYREECQLVCPQVYLDSFSVETGLDNFYIEKSKWQAVANGAEGYTAQANVVNNLSTP